MIVNHFPGVQRILCSPRGESQGITVHGQIVIVHDGYLTVMTMVNDLGKSWWISHKIANSQPL